MMILARTTSLFALLATALLIPTVLLAGDPAAMPPDLVSGPGPGVAPQAPRFGDNLIVNGNFETSAFGPDCHFNLSNNEFTDNVTGITAWGDADEIDYMNTGDSCGYLGPPQSGYAKISIHRRPGGGPTDAFCFDLTQTIQAGETYTVGFYVWPSTEFGGVFGAVEVGLSTDPMAFGTLVASGAGDGQGWTYVEQTFVAPITADYLCVQGNIDVESWNHLDNFVLEAGVTPVANRTWGALKSIYR